MKFLINLFRRFPTSTGLLFLVIIANLTNTQYSPTSMFVMQRNLLHIFFVYVIGMLLYMLFILPQIPLQNREKATWFVVMANVVIFTIFMLL